MERREAIEIVREYYPSSGNDLNEALETLIPELKESEDERIRKELIKETKGCEVRLFETVTNDEFVAWLEKRGDKKLVEPRVKDKEMVHYISNAISEPDASAYLKEKNIKVIDAHIWLENLLFEDKTGFPPQWKPSEEQMKCLLNAEGVLRADSRIAMAQELSSLYNDLKALCEK